jgi:hypothetical protein
MAWECTSKHAVVKELSGILAAYTRTSGRKVAQHLGLSRMCILNYKQWCLLINNGDLDLVKALKWSQGEKNSKGTVGNRKEVHRRQHHKA